MSAGHGNQHGLDTAPVSTAVLERLLQNPEIISYLLSYHNINYSYDLPYLAGYSQDGKTIYIDRHLPDELSYEIDGQKKIFQPVRFVKLHEIMEKACIAVLNWGYYHAHAAANGYERRGVLTGGLMWTPYNNALAPYIKADAREKLTKVPPDLDMTPYCASPVNKALIAHMQKAMRK